MLQKIEPFKFATQNMTEGLLTWQLKNASACVLQEVHKQKLESGLPKKYELFVPARDPHQAVMWDTRWLDVTSTGWTQFHKSGTTEDWPFKSPPRGMVWAKGRLVEAPDIKVVIFGLWLLNSWLPMKADHHTHLRHQIVQDLCLPKIEANIKKWHEADYLILGGGDINSIRWPGMIGHGFLKQPFDSGLDRIWVDRRLDIISKWDGPITGVGPDMKHASRIASLHSKGDR